MGWLDRQLQRARNARSDAEFEKVKRDMEDELPSSLVNGNGHRTDDGLSLGGGEDGTHLHLHLGAGGQGGGGMPGLTSDEPPANASVAPAPAAQSDPNSAGGDVNTRLAAVEAAVATLTQQLADLSGGDESEVQLEDPDTKDARSYILRRGKKIRRTAIGDESDIPVPGRNPDMIYETDLPGIEDLDRRRTGDSFAMESVWQDTLAKGEIIVPGIRVPTFDGRVAPTITAKRLCAFRRQTIDSAIRADNTKQLVETVTNLKNPDQVKNLRCDTLKMAFDVVAGAIGGNRNSGVMRASVGDSAGHQQTQSNGSTLALMQKRNREAWKSGEFKRPTV